MWCVTGQRIATISRTGQYPYESDAATKFTFTLGQYGAKLLIAQLPATTDLLLTEDDFEAVFQPHNLYFYAADGFPPGGLVPDPVYAPVQGPKSALSTSLAGSLVNGLINDRGSWLAGPTMTEFPKGTTLLRPVIISNQRALVDLGGKADTASQGQLALMYAQLVRTLTSSAYSPAVAMSVQLAIDGHKYPAGTAGSVPVAGSPALGPKPRTLYLASEGLVKQLTAGGKVPTLIPGFSQPSSPADVTAMAAAVTAVGQQVAAAEQQGNGCMVRVGRLGLPSTLRTYTISTAGGPCSSLDWDNNGGLWAVTGAGIWVLQAGNVRAVQVSVPTTLPSRARILALRMAPDAVRAALLVQIQGSTRLYVAAVRFGTTRVSFGPAVPVGSDLAAPGVAAMSWYNPYYLLAVSGSQLYQVPLTGGLSQALGTGRLPSGVRSLTASGGALAVSTTAGVVYTSLSRRTSPGPRSRAFHRLRRSPADDYYFNGYTVPTAGRCDTPNEARCGGAANAAET